MTKDKRGESLLWSVVRLRYIIILLIALLLITLGYITNPTPTILTYISLQSSSLGISLLVVVIAFFYVERYLLKEEQPAVCVYGSYYNDYPWAERISNSRREIIVVGIYYDSWIRQYLDELKDFLDRRGARLIFVVPNAKNKSIGEASSMMLGSNKTVGDILEKHKQMRSLFPESRQDQVDLIVIDRPITYAIVLFDEQFAALSLYEYQRGARIQSPVIEFDLGRCAKNVAEFFKREREKLLRPRSEE